MTSHRQKIFFEGVADDHLESIVRIANASFPEEFTKEGILQEIIDKRHNIYVAKYQGKDAGFAIVHEKEGDAYLWLFAVDSQYRGRKIASKLMDQIIDRARNEGYDRLKLLTFDTLHQMTRLCRRKKFVRTKKVSVERLIQERGWEESDKKWGKYAIYYQLNLRTNGNGYKEFDDMVVNLNLNSQYETSSESTLQSNVPFVSFDTNQ